MVEQNSLRVGVVFGGRSSEHEVSLSSARNVMHALQEAGHIVVPIGITRQGSWLTADPLRQLIENAETSRGEADAQDIRAPHRQSEPPAPADAWALLPHNSGQGPLPAIDVVFPVLHGPYGEDGTIQGLMEMANIPYVGCDVLSSALAMDKAVAKRLFASAGLAQTPSVLLMRPDWRENSDDAIATVEAKLAYPLFVKPSNLGSSVGVTKARNRTELGNAIDIACLYDRKVIVEQAVSNAREIEVSVLGNDQPIASVPGEIIPGAEFYDYNAKYVDDTSQLIIPAPLTTEQTAQVRDYAVRAFRAVNGSGLARVDFLLDDATGIIYLNELNTMPGFTRISMYPKLWEASGVTYSELVSRLVELALERFQDKQQNLSTR
jgi:D-alanine-D-alanine ligase